MSKEASVAPKERVNIVYKPATGDAKEEVELPLKMMVMGDFTGQESEEPLENRKAINVDKDNFDEVLAGMKVKLDTVVKNELSDDPDAEMSLSLEFKSIKDFEPDAIVEKVPELKKLKELRDALKAVKGPLGNIPEFRKKITELVKDKDKRDRLFKELGIEE
ncbi:MAG: type secretion system protein ImpB [Desulfonauticus sp.]|jgi:type VI secretion system protein ImpB|nr:MAG: Type VI secretion protein, VC_A0107 family [Desulfonauticus sp. 38_4375]MDK2921477.1 type secretion system protein ImpB [Desulfonauticus sp.]